MGNKTSQLQIRISPEQKDALKRLAKAAGMGVSRYVLSTVLPTSRVEFTRRAHELSQQADRVGALAELWAFVTGLPADELVASVRSLDVHSLAPVVRNQVAAAVEAATGALDQPPPDWTHSVEPLGRPHFARDLNSLRPNQLRITPVVLKRRNAFVDIEGLAARRPARGPHADALGRLESELARRDLLVELCAVGGACFPLVWAVKPPTRRVGALFREPALLDEAAAVVATERALPDDWLNVAVRATLAGPPGTYVEDGSLRVFEAPGAYVLAVKCAALACHDTPALRAEVGRLLAILGLGRSTDALAVAGEYLAERQLPAELPAILKEQLSQ